MTIKSAQPGIISPIQDPSTQRVLRDMQALVGGDLTTLHLWILEVIRFPHAIGEPVPWYSETVPSLCVELNGDSYVRTEKADLFAVYGTLFGAADSTHFNVWDLRGLTLRGWNHGKSSGMYDPDAATRTKPTATGATISDGDHVGTEQWDAMQRIKGDIDFGKSLQNDVDSHDNGHGVISVKEASRAAADTSTVATRPCGFYFDNAGESDTQFKTSGDGLGTSGSTPGESRMKNVAVMYITRYAWI